MAEQGIIPGVCPVCQGRDEACGTCLGTGKAAYAVPAKCVVFGKTCPDCGGTNGASFITETNPGPFIWGTNQREIPVDGAKCAPGGCNYCPSCGRVNHMVWEKLTDG